MSRDRLAHPGHDRLEPISRTAIGVALVRAEESRRPDRLFVDALAEAFLTAFAERFPRTPVGAGMVGPLGEVLRTQIVVRTRFYDDRLLAAGRRQVVLLAAGLDTRAFRLDWPPGTAVYELDLPAVLAFKDEVLAAQHAPARCERTVVPADLGEDWPAELIRVGFDAAVPTAWLIEGLLVYLTADQAKRLLASVSGLSAAGSRLSFEHRSTAGYTRLLALARSTPIGERLATLWHGGMGDETEPWLTGHGWQVHTEDLEEVAARYGRPMSGRSGGFFVTATYGGPP